MHAWCAHLMMSDMNQLEFWVGICHQELPLQSMQNSAIALRVPGGIMVVPRSGPVFCKASLTISPLATILCSLSTSTMFPGPKESLTFVWLPTTTSSRLILTASASPWVGIAALIWHVHRLSFSYVIVGEASVWASY